MHNSELKLGILLAFLTFHALPLPAHSFGQDVCFNAPTSGLEPIRNCVGVEESCRTSNLTPAQAVTCRAEAFQDSLSGLNGSNGIIGGRSLVHSDSTYLMAQIIGYTPWQAYQIAIYNEATDQSDYVPFDQSGRQLLDDNAISQCRSDWGLGMPRDCLIITKEMNGVSRFNDESGGMLLHLHARYSPDGQEPPVIGLPADYLSPENAPYEPILTNLQDWALDRRQDACVSGILAFHQGGSSASKPCEVRDRVITSPQSVFALGFPQLQIPFSSNLGRLIIHDDGQSQVLATDRSFQNFLTPHQVTYAKLGIFLHAYADRVSHHMCTDRSWFQRQISGHYDSNYDQVYCAQGSHFLWHAWEQGTDQHDANLEPEFQTMRPALQGTGSQLLEHARSRQLPLKSGFNVAALIDKLVEVLSVSDPKSRLDSMVTLTEGYGALPLPGHGSAASLSIEEWLDLAGAPANTGILDGFGPGNTPPFPLTATDNGASIQGLLGPTAGTGTVGFLYDPSLNLAVIESDVFPAGLSGPFSETFRYRLQAPGTDLWTAARLELLPVSGTPTLTKKICTDSAFTTDCLTIGPHSSLTPTAFLPLLKPANTIYVEDTVEGSGGDGIDAFFNAFEAQPVPGPLPIVGAWATFGWSRRIRRRIQASR